MNKNKNKGKSIPDRGDDMATTQGHERSLSEEWGSLWLDCRKPEKTQVEELNWHQLGPILQHLQ